MPSVDCVGVKSISSVNNSVVSCKVKSVINSLEDPGSAPPERESVL